MAVKRNFAITVTLLLIGCQLSLVNGDISTTPTSDELSPKVQEKISLYESSIRYWDTKNPEVQTSILKELARSSEEANQFCPRIRFPLICDSDGVILENSCFFRLKRREKAGILPIMIFTNTAIEQARPLCELEIKKKPSRT